MDNNPNYYALKLISWFFKVMAFIILLAGAIIIFEVIKNEEVLWTLLLGYGMGIFVSVVLVLAFSELIILFVNLSINSDKQISATNDMTQILHNIFNEYLVKNKND